MPMPFLLPPPIAEMTEATPLPRRAGTGQAARLELPITREGLAATLAAASARLTPFARRPADVTERELLEAAVDALAGLATRPPPPGTPDS